MYITAHSAAPSELCAADATLSMRPITAHYDQPNTHTHTHTNTMTLYGWSVCYSFYPFETLSTFKCGFLKFIHLFIYFSTHPVIAWCWQYYWCWYTSSIMHSQNFLGNLLVERYLLFSYACFNVALPECYTHFLNCSVNEDTGGRSLCGL